MSRSYKKTPYCGDRKHNKEFANRKVRNYIGLLKRNAFKKIFPQYDICDYYNIAMFDKFYESRLLYYKNLEKYTGKKINYTKKQALKDWDKWYRRK